MAALHELVSPLNRSHMVSTMTPGHLISDEGDHHQQKQKTKNPPETSHASRYLHTRVMGPHDEAVENRTKYRSTNLF